MYWSLATSSTDLSSSKDIRDSTAIVVASTLPIVDSNGAVTPPVQIHPVVQLGGMRMSHLLRIPAALTHLLATPISSLQMFACNIISQNTTIQVSSVSRMPVDIPPSAQNALWHEWTPAGPTSDPILLGVGLQRPSKSPLTIPLGFSII